jgi:O-antigen/teichoic acid export membrane protein
MPMSVSGNRRWVILRKWVRRGAIVFQNSLNNLLLPIFNIYISGKVVRMTSAALWGEFVAVMVAVQFGAHLVSWGNKEYLLREFSLHPTQITRNWQTSLISRIPLFVLVSLALIFTGYSLERALLCLIWGAGIALAQSYEVVVLYRRAFISAFVIEGVGIAITTLFVITKGAAITADDLLLVFAGVGILKAVAYVMRFSDLLGNLWQEIRVKAASLGSGVDLSYFSAALPFFLLGFSGLLASRIDVYSVTHYLQKSDVGEYQIFINLMLYLQSVSVFIVGPYVKTVYRLNDDAILKISLRLFGLGIALTLAGLVASYLVFTLVYEVQYSWQYMALGGLFVLPIFAYLPLIYRLYKLNRTGLVLKANLIGAAVNFILNALLLPHIGSIGAVLASAVVQWGMLVVYLTEVRGENPRALPEVSPAD